VPADSDSPREAADDRVAAARAAVASNSTWYHTMELAPGVVTPGYVDLRAVAERVLPDDLSGRRCVDIGTFDGFWAFEMERRGGTVVATDVEKIDDAEWPPHRREELRRGQAEYDVRLGRGFELASAALGSAVERVVCNIYELAPERVGGEVDFAFIGALLLHLRDPVRGLERTRETLRAGGELRVFEPYSRAVGLRSRRPAARFLPLETSFNWWVPNLAGLEAWLRVAGFQAPRRLGTVRPPARPEMRQRYATLAASR
jgi:SAM-dependent methyltransferase